MAEEFTLDFKVLQHLRGYPEELQRYSNLIKQVHPRGISALEFLLKRPASPDMFLETICRLVRNGEEIMTPVEAAERAGTSPQVFLDQIAAHPDFPAPLFRQDRRVLWRRADVEAYLVPREQG